MRTTLYKYACDHPDCDMEVAVPAEDQFQSEGWLVVDTFVIGAGSGKQYFCKNCKHVILKALFR